MSARYFNGFSICYFAGLLSVLLLGLLVNDPLLHRSGVYNLAVLASFLALFACLPFAGIALVGNFIVPRIIWRMGQGLVLGLIGTGFILSGVDGWMTTLQGVRLALLLTVTFLGCFVAGAALPAALGSRITFMAKGSLAAAMFLLIGATAWFHTETWRAPHSPPQHAVLVVVDGWPPQLWNSYNDQSRSSEIDKLASQGRLYSRAYTNKPYTWGWFSSFYTGELGANPDQHLQKPDLLSKLESEGVNTRIINFHSNSIPDAITDSTRSSLRSIFLTEKHAWIPEFLGLDYDVFLSWPQTRQGASARARLAYAMTSAEFDDFYLWYNFIPAQIRSLRERNRSSFLIIHVNHNLHTTQAMVNLEESRDQIEDFYQRAGENYYHYAPDDEPIMDFVREQYLERHKLYGQRLLTLQEMLQQFGGSNLLVITADHGTALGGGRVWYGYHADEEVIRVPLLILGTDISPSVRSEAVDTLDTRATILDYFGLPPDSDEGRSLIQSKLNERSVAVSTLPAQDIQQHLFVKYSGGVKYTFNIHPEGKGESWQESFDGFSRISGPESPVLPSSPIWSTLAIALRQFGLKEHDVHAAIWRKANRD